MRRSRGAITDADDALEAPAAVASTGLPLVDALVPDALYLEVGAAVVVAPTDAALVVAGRTPFRLRRHALELPEIAELVTDTGLCAICDAPPDEPSLDDGRLSTMQSSSSLGPATLKRTSSSGIVLVTRLLLWPESRFHTSSSCGRGDRRAGCCSVGGAITGMLSRGGATMTTGPPPAPPWIEVAAVPASETADVDAAHEYDEDAVVVVELDGERCSGGGGGGRERAEAEVVLRVMWTGGSAATALS